MKKTVKILILTMAVIMMFSLFGCGRNKQFDFKTYQDEPAGTLLIDCFERTVGTPMEMPYAELVLYTYSKEQVKLEQYINGGSEDEIVKTRLVPARAAQDALDAVEKSGMNSWNDRKDTVGLNGKLYVCKFPDGKGGYVRVSSEQMPEDGTDAFYAVRAALASYLNTNPR